MLTNWNETSVREELPTVKVLCRSGAVVDGEVRGRRNPFATVFFSPVKGMEYAVDFAWPTIADALNNDRPIRA